MSEQDRVEIERLIEEVVDKRQKVRWLGMCNMPTDPAESRKSAIAYELAITEAMEAEAKLAKARRALTGP